MRTEIEGGRVLVHLGSGTNNLSPDEAEAKADELREAAEKARQLPDARPGTLYHDDNGTIYVVADPESQQFVGHRDEVILWRLDLSDGASFATVDYWRTMVGVTFHRVLMSSGGPLVIGK